MDINAAISYHVKKVREERKLTLDAAAALTGVSRSMLAQIEKGDVNPTISVLWKIANGYKVSFTSLVESKVAENTFIPCTTPILEDDDGKYLNYPTFPFDEKKLFEMYRIVIEEGGCLKASPHLASSEEYVTVFTGEVEITVGSETYRLEEGDSLRFRADTAHSYRNMGSQRAAMSMVIAYAAPQNP